MNKQLPYFKYHPDPIYTGVFEPLDEKCDCCGEISHYVYTPSVYSTHDIDALCPWCIASGKVKEKRDSGSGLVFCFLIGKTQELIRNRVTPNRILRSRSTT